MTYGEESVDKPRSVFGNINIQIRTKAKLIGVGDYLIFFVDHVIIVEKK